MALLEMRDVSVTYRSGGLDVPAVRGVSLSVDSGQTLGIAGESGFQGIAVAVEDPLPRLVEGQPGERHPGMPPGFDDLAADGGRFQPMAIQHQGALGDGRFQRVGRESCEILEKIT